MLVLVASGAAIVQAHLAGPPPGYTGAPGEGTCGDAGCHDAPPADRPAGVRISLISDNRGDTLRLYILAADNSIGDVANRYGFEATVLDSISGPVGNLVVLDSVRTQLATGADRTYIMHTEDGTGRYMCSNCSSWEFAWIRPVGLRFPVHIYMAGIIADDDAGPVGDVVHWTSLRIPTCEVLITGDVAANGSITSSDIIYLVGFVFKGAAEPVPCTAAGDVNCSGNVTLADIIYLVNFLFRSGPAPCDVCPLREAGIWLCG